jgi:hypothetical protein
MENSKDKARSRLHDVELQKQVTRLKDAITLGEQSPNGLEHLLSTRATALDAEAAQFLATGGTFLRKTDSSDGFVIEQLTLTTNWHHRLTCLTPEIREYIFNILINKQNFRDYEQLTQP